jgi:Arylmalonate decarboxylase
VKADALYRSAVVAQRAAFYNRSVLHLRQIAEAYMSETIKATIGFVSGGSASMPHYRSFFPLVPSEIKLDLYGLELYRDSLYEIADKKETIVKRVIELAGERNWNGAILTAAPTEVLNPGIYDDLTAALPIPFTTALHACVAALRVYEAKRVLLLTPFDQRLNELICRYLADAGVTAVAPHPFDQLSVPKRMDPDEVFELTKTQLNPADPVDAIYFQGAVLDPIKALERMETELGTTVIASNPAMLWYVLSRLGLSYPMAGYGRLMREWPAQPAFIDSVRRVPG